jgi:antitoxin component YwqK of YwqJK toxin-antitoxin module
VLCRNKVDLLPSNVAQQIMSQNVYKGLQQSFISVKNGLNFLGPIVQIVNQLKYPYNPPQQVPEPKSLFSNVLTQLGNITSKCETPDKRVFQGEPVVRKTIECGRFIYTFECKPEFEEFDHDPSHENGGGLHGRWTKSNIAGRLLVEATYNNGKRHGKLIVWDLSQDGIQYSSEVTMYSNGVKHGDSIKYYPSTKNEVPTRTSVLGRSGGMVKEQKSYQNGLLHGSHTEFNKNGIKVLEKLWNKGMLDGSHRQWYGSGLPKSDSVYINGHQIGKHTEWHANGCIKVEGEYNLEYKLPHGLWKYYHQDGYIEKIVERSYDFLSYQNKFPILKTTTYFSSGKVCKVE